MSKIIGFSLNETILIMCFFLIASYGQYGYAEVMQVPVRVPCSENLLSVIKASWVEYSGIPGVRYSLVTNGLLDSDKEGVMRVSEKKGFFGGVTDDNVGMIAVATCIPRRGEADMSLTGSIFRCETGEGIRIKMVSPNNVNPNKYQYAGTLMLVKDEEDEIIDSIESITFGVNDMSVLSNKMGLDIPNIHSTIEK